MLRVAGWPRALSASRAQDFDAFYAKLKKGDFSDHDFEASRTVWRATGFCVRHPCIMLLVMLGPLLCAALALSVPFEVDASNALVVRDDITAERLDAANVMLGHTYFDVPPAEQDEADDVPQQSQVRFALTILYEAPEHESIFRVDHLNAIRDMHRRIESVPRYKEFCVLAPDPSDPSGDKKVCQAPFTVINHFFKSEVTLPASALARGGAGGGMPPATMMMAANGSSSMMMMMMTPSAMPAAGNVTLLIPDGRGKMREDPEKTLADLYASLPPLVEPFVDTDFVEFNYRSSITRAIFSFALPLEGYESADDRFDEQKKAFEDWILGNITEIVTQANEDGEADSSIVGVYFVGSGVTEAQINEVILADGSLVFGAIVFVYLYTWFHVRSGFLACLGMLHVMMSFPVAYFIFRFLVGVEKFGMLNTLSIFVLLGIGADDIFLMVDAFKQSKVMGPSVSRSLHHRLAFTWSRASKAMLITSLT